MNYNCKKILKLQKLSSFVISLRKKLNYFFNFENFNIIDNGTNVFNNQPLVISNNAPLLRYDLVQEKNASFVENKTHAVNNLQRGHGRNNFSTNPNFSTKLKSSLVFIFAILLLVSIVCITNVHVFPEVDAIATQCKYVADQSCFTIFLIVLRLKFLKPRVLQWHCHNK